MTRHVRFLGILLVASALVFGAALPSAQAAWEVSVAINPADYDAQSHWSDAGPAYEGSEEIGTYGATHTHAFGAGTGQFVYHFRLDRANAQFRSGTISARLSSEFPWYSGPSDGYSDVTLVLNGDNYETKRVIPDNGSGAMYTWSVRGESLRNGENTLSLAVRPDAEYRNGLAIYYHAVVPGHSDTPIAVTVSGETLERAPAATGQVLGAATALPAGDLMSWPTTGTLGWIFDPKAVAVAKPHFGIDILGPKDAPGTVPVYAAYPGTVAGIYDSCWNPVPAGDQAAVTVVLKHDYHGATVSTRYLHMAKEKGDSYVNSDLTPGKTVNRGDFLGYMGDRRVAITHDGCPKIPDVVNHLHFDVQLPGSGSVDPSDYLGMALSVDRGQKHYSLIPVTAGVTESAPAPAVHTTTFDDRISLLSATHKYYFDGQAGQTVTIDMVRTDGGLDPYVYLIAPNGRQLMKNDDDGGNQNARIADFRLPETGRYRVVASRFRWTFTTGAFTLTIRVEGGNQAAGAFRAGRIGSFLEVYAAEADESEPPISDVTVPTAPAEPDAHPAPAPVSDYAPPDQPSPTGPASGSVITGAGPTLTWTGVSSPSGGQVQYWVAVFDSPVNYDSGWIDGSAWRVSQADGHPGLYNWHVKSIDRNTGKESGWSAVYQFTMAPPRDSTELRLDIRRAMYGINNNWVDATQKVRTYVQNDERIAMRVTNDVVNGADPAYGTRKQLVVTYRNRWNEEYQVTVWENDTLSLTRDSRAGTYLLDGDD